MTPEEFINPDTKRPLLIYPHPILLTPTSFCTLSEYQITRITSIMYSIMYANKGIGLAANQVGLSVSFLVMNPTGDPQKLTKQKYFINPKIIAQSATSTSLEERCLSLPKLRLFVRRPKSITLEHMLIDGKFKTECFEGNEARILCHEIDHLNGKTLIDHIGEEEHKQLTDKELVIKSLI